MSGGFNAEGAGRAFEEFRCHHILTLGKPKMLRGETVGDSYEKERKMTWSELFFDLIFVTGVRQLGDMLRERLLAPGGEMAAEEEEGLTLTEYVVYFLLLWTLWTECSNYGTRWGVNDVFNFFHFGLYMFGVVVVVSSLGTSAETLSRLYLAVLFSYACGFVTNARIAYYYYDGKRKAGKYGVREAAFCLVKVAISLVGWYLVHHHPEAMTGEGSIGWIWPAVALVAFSIFAPLIQMIGWQAGIFPASNIPFHIEHYSERVSLLMVIYLGDGVDNLASATHSHDPPFGRVAIGFALLLALKVLLLDSCEVEPEQHAIRRHWVATFAFLQAQMAQALGLAFVSSGLAMGLMSPTAEAYTDAQWLLADGCAILLGAFLVTALAHKPHDAVVAPPPSPDHPSAYYRTLLRRVYAFQVSLNVVAICLCVFAAHAPLPPFRAPTTLLSLLAILLLLLGAANLLDEVVQGRLEKCLVGAHAEHGEHQHAINEQPVQPPHTHQSVQGASPPEFAAALDALCALVQHDSTLRHEALQALQRPKAMPGAAAGPTLNEPLLAAATGRQ